jgi:hypothetical protein
MGQIKTIKAKGDSYKQSFYQEHALQMALLMQTTTQAREKLDGQLGLAMIWVLLLRCTPLCLLETLDSVTWIHQRL